MRKRFGESRVEAAGDVIIAVGTFGWTHADTASVLNDLGVHYRDSGRYDEASRVHRRALAIAEKGNEANRRLGPPAKGGERKLRKDGKPRRFVRRYLAVDPEDGELCMHEEISTRSDRRYISQPEFIQRCLDVDSEVPMDPELWMHLLIAAGIDLPPERDRVAERRHEIAKRLREAIIERGDRAA